MPCLDEDTITDLLAGRVRLDAPGIEEHLQSCAACARLIGLAAAELDANGTDSGPVPATTLRVPPFIGLPIPGVIPPGTKLNATYEVLRLVGRGGMGEVYEVRHTRLAGRYAVKVLRADVSSDEELLSRFRREAEITSALRHPNIVQVMDFDRTLDGHFFLAMELLPGCDLAALLRKEGRLSVERALSMLEQITSALWAAHRQGIVHRDLKPANVFVLRDEGDGREHIKLMDFGLSKWNRGTLDVSLVFSHDHALIGTPMYMAPEQARGQNREVTPATDQFALAAILFEMLTGRLPFPAANLAQVLYAITFEPPAELNTLCPELPTGLGAVINRALAKSQRDRFASVQDFLRAIERAAANPTWNPAAAPRRWRWRLPMAAVLVGAGTIAAALPLIKTQEAPAPVTLSRPSTSEGKKVEPAATLATSQPQLTAPAPAEAKPIRKRASTPKRPVAATLPLASKSAAADSPADSRGTGGEEIPSNSVEASSPPHAGPDGGADSSSLTGNPIIKL